MASSSRNITTRSMRNTQSQDDNTLQNIAQNEPQSPLNNDESEDATERTTIEQIQERLSIIERENQQSRQEQHQTMQQILDYMRANQAMPLPQDSPAQERGTPDMTMSQQLAGKHYSKKLPDPIPLSDGNDPTFKSWRIQMQGKFRANKDHFADEEDKMLYLFNRTTGNAQKYLQPRYEEDSFDRFASANEMIQYLTTIPEFINPHEQRDARYEYTHLQMTPGQSFSEFHTQFLHLAGEARVPMQDRRLDLYDRLTTSLKRHIAVSLPTLTTYEMLSASCLSLDNELRRINIQVEQEKRRRSNALIPARPFQPIIQKPIQATGTVPSDGSFSKSYRNAEPPAYSKQTGQATSGIQLAAPHSSKTFTCYSCGKQGHIAPDCLEKKKETDLKEIEEQERMEDGMEEAQESGKEEA
jgi:hypothetical protein